MKVTVKTEGADTDRTQFALAVFMGDAEKALVSVTGSAGKGGEKVSAYDGDGITVIPFEKLMDGTDTSASTTLQMSMLNGVMQMINTLTKNLPEESASWLSSQLGSMIHFLTDDFVQLFAALQDTFKTGDQFQDIRILFPERFHFQIGQALQAHIQNGLGLDFGEGKTLHQADTGFFRALAGTDQGYDFVQVIQGNHQALQDMGTGPGLLQFIFRTAGNDLLLVVNIAGDQVLEAVCTPSAAQCPAHGM